MVLVYLAIVHLISIYGIIYLYSKLYLLRCVRLYGKLCLDYYNDTKFTGINIKM